MNKYIILSTFLLISLIGFSSAYSTTYGQSYQYAAPSTQIVYPSYTYAPTVNSQTLTKSVNSNTYTNNYQGPFIQKVNTYDQTYTQGRKGKISLTISSKQYETYVGANQYTNSGSQQSSQSASNYNSYSPNPTSYNGGSYWRYGPTYSSAQSGSNSYADNYYYAPRYDSNLGYYNWRY